MPEVKAENNAQLDIIKRLKSDIVNRSDRSRMTIFEKQKVIEMPS